VNERLTETMSDPANLRDLGGLRTNDGRVVRTGRLFRSELPTYAEGLEAYAPLGLRTVVDLRRAEEIRPDEAGWGATVDWHSFPVIAGTQSPWRAGYDLYFSGDTAGIVAAIRVLTRPEAHPALFHCAAGRDRTGVVAAMLLTVLDVSDEDIVADYVASGHRLKAVLDRLAAMPTYAEALDGWTVEDHAPRPERILELLDWLHEQGGVERWLSLRGVSLAALDGFRAAMLNGGTPARSDG
jgi:protein-tyrosine phosphatase